MRPLALLTLAIAAGTAAAFGHEQLDALRRLLQVLKRPGWYFS